LEDPDCLRGLASLIQLIRNGQMGDLSRDFLLENPLVGVPKPSGSERPIVMQETLYKMAAVHGLYEVMPGAIDLLGEDQFAICLGGAGSAALALKAGLEWGTGVTTDLENAFNKMRRDVMLTRTYAQSALAACFRLVDWAYSKPTWLRVIGPDGEPHFIASSQGPRQGDPVALMLFCVALKPEIDAGRAAGGEHVVAVADVDDVNFIEVGGSGDGSSVAAATRAFKQGVETNLGMSFQGKKSAFLAFHDRPLSNVLLQCATDLGMPIERDARVMVGTPMGPNRPRASKSWP
jgi:hypothetical protein